MGKIIPAKTRNREKGKMLEKHHQVRFQSRDDDRLFQWKTIVMEMEWTIEI